MGEMRPVKQTTTATTEGKSFTPPLPLPVPLPVSVPIAVTVPARPTLDLLSGPTITKTNPNSLPAMSAQQAGAEAATASWNSQSLGLRCGADAVAASAAAVLVAPLITAIDRGIIENASGRRTLGESLRASLGEVVRRPVRFFGGRPFGLIFMLYFGTYLTANTIDTASSTLQNTAAHTTTAGTSKFLATSTSNLALCLYKDNRFTQLFGSVGSNRPVPLPTFALFTVRDCLTIFASFNLPTLLSPSLEQHMGDQVRKYVTATSAAQFLTPAAVQIVSTPLHLLGLDLYNRQGVSKSERMRRVVRDWGKSAFARMGRIVPAFGVGGVVNAKVRRNLMERIEQ